MARRRNKRESRQRVDITDHSAVTKLAFQPVYDMLPDPVYVKELMGEIDHEVDAILLEIGSL